jgi:hypothetical protein
LVVISRDPTDPNKTRVAILAHANPGGGIPQWVSVTFYFFMKFIVKIQEGIQANVSFYPCTQGHENCSECRSTNRTLQAIL